MIVHHNRISVLSLSVLQAARQFCPHHVGHYLGMDVHDTPELSRSQPLQHGMVITIEPGGDLFFINYLIRSTDRAMQKQNPNAKNILVFNHHFYLWLTRVVHQRGRRLKPTAIQRSRGANRGRRGNTGPWGTPYLIHPHPKNHRWCRENLQRRDVANSSIKSLIPHVF